MEYTVDDVLAMRPCSEYTRERIEELFGDRDTLTVSDVDALPISQDDIPNSGKQS